MFFGIGLHILIAVYFAIHCVRRGGQLFWLFILFSFPLLGSLVYFMVEYLPELRAGGGVTRAARSAVRALDPSRELREAKDALELTPTAHNRMRLANALLAAGQAAEAAAQYDLCLQGPFATDDDIGFAAAQARLSSGQAPAAIELLQAIRARNPDFRGESVAVLLGRAWSASGHPEEAGRELEAAQQRYGGIESRGEYAIWAAAHGQLETALRIQRDLEKSWASWNGHTRALHRPLIKRIEAALSTAPRTAA